MLDEYYKYEMSLWLKLSQREAPVLNQEFSEIANIILRQNN